MHKLLQPRFIAHLNTEYLYYSRIKLVANGFLLPLQNEGTEGWEILYPITLRNSVIKYN